MHTSFCSSCQLMVVARIFDRSKRRVRHANHKKLEHLEGAIYFEQGDTDSIQSPQAQSIMESVSCSFVSGVHGVGEPVTELG